MFEGVSNPRRRNMQANRRRDTTPEMALRRALHKEGLRYRCDLPISLPEGVRARPDIVFTRRKVAVFVDGCFWHGCPLHGTRPVTNAEYWSAKISGNIRRDQMQTRALRNAGWAVIRISEHESVDNVRAQVVAALNLVAIDR
ncbi:very short patch repair endonuclease [Microbacterium sp. SSM24]|uniref:very short patch repair endonuclease n=1 Tax=Microbacterium sp. SSM24 TaxID=2991714 RepID=UPI0022277271|nr:very short patch repair endonuclease [Microbacterium sp. SSM24]MCW3493892.1 very short patch repair endonuclease [Microbacterium sp. SSM24]